MKVLRPITRKTVSAEIRCKLFRRSGLPLLAALLVAGSFNLQADTISSNLSNVSAGVETATGITWLTASFGTLNSAAMLQDITLLLANSFIGTAELDLYSNGTLAPGSLVGTLTSPAAYSASLTSTTFTGNAITLSANSTYWLVLKATTGAFDWSWTADNTGVGTGYQGTWGVSTDSGITWFTSDTYPLQFSVTTSASTSAAAVAEPGTWILSAAGLLLGGFLLRKQSLAGKVLGS